jgi:hypothetical protein
VQQHAVSVTEKTVAFGKGMIIDIPPGIAGESCHKKEQSAARLMEICYHALRETEFVARDDYDISFSFKDLSAFLIHYGKELVNGIVWVHGCQLLINGR